MWQTCILFAVLGKVLFAENIQQHCGIHMATIKPVHHIAGNFPRAFASWRGDRPTEVCAFFFFFLLTWIVSQTLSLFHLSKYHCFLSSLWQFHSIVQKTHKSGQPWVNGNRVYSLCGLVCGHQPFSPLCSADCGNHLLPTDFGPIRRL